MSNAVNRGAPTGASNYDDFAAFTALARDGKRGSPDAVRETARQFESLFVRMVLKSMREASFGDPIFGSNEMDSYRDMFDDQMSLELTRGKGIGLADLLVRQLRQSGSGSGTGSATGTGSSGAAGNPTGSAPSSAAGRSPYARPAAPSSAAAESTPAAAAEPAPGATGAAPNAASAPSAPWAPSAAPAGDPDRAAFMRELWPSAAQAGEALGVDPLTLIAHAALETGWGQSLPGGARGAGSLAPASLALPSSAGATAAASSHNLFGIKAGTNWTGATVAARTVEFETGLPTVKTERFRAYASTADGFQDYVALLQGDPRYADALGTGGDVRAFGAALQRAGYATDPRYAAKLEAVAAALKQVAPPPLTPSQGGT